MNKKCLWKHAGTTALALLLSQQPILAEDPPRDEQIEIEVEANESVQKVAEKAAEAAKAIAAEAAAKAQEKAAKIAAEAAEHAQQAAEKVVEEVTKAAGEAAKQARITGSFKPAPFQLGLRVAPVPKALDAQLKLEGKGILIDVVEKDGPGEKAGLKPHDIVISVAEQDVKSPADLAKTLTDSEGKELKFDLIRAGEKLEITIQPRPVVERLGLQLPRIDIDEEIIQLESKIREKLKGAGVDVRMQVIHPGRTMPTDVLKRGEVPEGVSISVRKEGGKPAKIEVSRGEEKWEVTEESLDKLPEDLRPHVDRMLGKFTAPLPPGVVVAAKAPLAERHREAKRKVEEATVNYKLEANFMQLDSIARTLQEIKKDIHRLYDQIDELREDRKKKG